MPIHRPTICHVYVNGAQKLSRRPMQDSVFIAHTYHREQAQMEDYRLPYQDALEKRLRYRAVFADLEALPGSLLYTICQHIIDTEVGVYDVTGYNENVLIELGLALGLNRPALIVAKDDDTPLPAFLEDLNPLRYRSRKELAEGLAQRVPEHMRSASDGRISPRYCESCLAECPLVRQRAVPVEEAYAVIGVDEEADEDLHYNLAETMERFEMHAYADEDHAHPHTVCAWVYRLRRVQVALFHLRPPYRVAEQAAVHLQVGIAAGLGTPWTMILPADVEKAPTDLRGLLHVNFGDYHTGFRQQLSNSIRGLLLNRLNAPQIYAPLPRTDPALLDEEPALADLTLPEGATVVLLVDEGDAMLAIIKGPVISAFESDAGPGRALLHARTPEAVFELWRQAGDVALIVMGFDPPLRSADLREGLAALDEGTNRPPVVSVYLNANDAVIDVRDTALAFIRETFTLPQDELASFAPAFINRQLAPPESPRRVLVLLDADDTTNDPQNRRAIRELVAANYPALFEFTTPEADAFRGRLAVRDRRPDAVVIDGGALGRIGGKAFFDALTDTGGGIPVLYDATDISPGDYARAQVYGVIDNNPLAEIAFPLVAETLRESLDRAFSGALGDEAGEPAARPDDITVLVLDADATRPALVAALKPEGYTLLEAHTVRSAQDAIELFQRGNTDAETQDTAPPARLINVVALRDTSYDFEDLRDTVSLFRDLSPGVRVIVMQPQYETDRVAEIEGVVGIFSGDEPLLPDALVRNVRDVLAYPPELADAASRPDAPTLLIVDDYDDWRVSLREMLAGTGWRIAEATNNAGALERIAEGDITLLMTDVHRSGKYGERGNIGLEMVREVEASYPDVKTVIISRHKTDRLRELAPEIRPWANLDKSTLTAEALRETLLRVLDGERLPTAWDDPAPGAYVYLSFDEADRDRVRILRGSLSDAGIAHWNNEGDMRYARAEEGIQGAAALLYLGSPAARASSLVQQEIDMAARFGTTIYLVWLDGATWEAAAPQDTVAMEGIDLRGEAYGQNINNLTWELNRALGAAAGSAAAGPDFEQLSPEQLEAWLEQMAERMADRRGALAAIRAELEPLGTARAARYADFLYWATGGHPRLIPASLAITEALPTGTPKTWRDDALVGRLARVPAAGQAARAIWETLGDAEREVLQRVASGEQQMLEDEGQAAMTRVVKGRLLRVDAQNQALLVEPPLFRAAIQQNFVIEAEADKRATGERPTIPPVDGDQPIVFISYSSQDTEFSRRLHDDLEASGIKTWIDFADMKPGDNWRNSRNAALRGARMMVLVVSPAAMESKYVSDEWQFFLDEGKPVIPVMYKRVDSPHFQLRRLQYIDFRGVDSGRRYDEAFQQLMQALRDVLGRQAAANKAPGDDIDVYANINDDVDDDTQSSSSSSRRSSGGGFLRRIFGGRDEDEDANDDG